MKMIDKNFFNFKKKLLRCGVLLGGPSFSVTNLGKINTTLAHNQLVFLNLDKIVTSWTSFQYLANSLRIQNQKCLFVTSNLILAPSVFLLAKKLQAFYVIGYQWIPGSLTNLRKDAYVMNTHAFQKRRFSLHNLLTSKTGGQTRLKHFQKPSIFLTHLPDLVFFFNLNRRMQLIFREVSQYLIPTIGIVDSSQPFALSYSLPGNSNSLPTFYFYLKFLMFYLLRHKCNGDFITDVNYNFTASAGPLTETSQSQRSPATISSFASSNDRANVGRADATENRKRWHRSFTTSCNQRVTRANTVFLANSSNFERSFTTQRALPAVQDPANVSKAYVFRSPWASQREPKGKHSVPRQNKDQDRLLKMSTNLSVVLKALSSISTRKIKPCFGSATNTDRDLSRLGRRFQSRTFISIGSNKETAKKPKSKTKNWWIKKPWWLWYLKKNFRKSNALRKAYEKTYLVMNLSGLLLRRQQLAQVGRGKLRASALPTFARSDLNFKNRHKFSGTIANQNYRWLTMQSNGKFFMQKKLNSVKYRQTIYYFRRKKVLKLQVSKRQMYFNLWFKSLTGANIRASQWKNVGSERGLDIRGPWHQPNSCKAYAVLANKKKSLLSRSFRKLFMRSKSTAWSRVVKVSSPRKRITRRTRKLLQRGLRFTGSVPFHKTTIQAKKKYRHTKWRFKKFRKGRLWLVAPRWYKRIPKRFWTTTLVGANNRYFTHMVNRRSWATRMHLSVVLRAFSRHFRRIFWKFPKFLTFFKISQLTNSLSNQGIYRKYKSTIRSLMLKFCNNLTNRYRKRQIKTLRSFMRRKMLLFKIRSSFWKFRNISHNLDKRLANPELATAKSWARMVGQLHKKNKISYISTFTLPEQDKSKLFIRKHKRWKKRSCFMVPTTFKMLTKLYQLKRRFNRRQLLQINAKRWAKKQKLLNPSLRLFRLRLKQSLTNNKRFQTQHELLLLSLMRKKEIWLKRISLKHSLNFVKEILRSSERRQSLRLLTSNCRELKVSNNTNNKLRGKIKNDIKVLFCKTKAGISSTSLQSHPLTGLQKTKSRTTETADSTGCYKYVHFSDISHVIYSSGLRQLSNLPVFNEVKINQATTFLISTATSTVNPTFVRKIKLGSSFARVSLIIQTQLRDSFEQTKIYYFESSEFDERERARGRALHELKYSETFNSKIGETSINLEIIPAWQILDNKQISKPSSALKPAVITINYKLLPKTKWLTSFWSLKNNIDSHNAVGAHALMYNTLFLATSSLSTSSRSSVALQGPQVTFSKYRLQRLYAIKHLRIKRRQRFVSSELRKAYYHFLSKSNQRSSSRSSTSMRDFRAPVQLDTQAKFNLTTGNGKTWKPHKLMAIKNKNVLLSAIKNVDKTLKKLPATLRATNQLLQRSKVSLFSLRRKTTSKIVQNTSSRSLFPSVDAHGTTEKKRIANKKISRRVQPRHHSLSKRSTKMTASRLPYSKKNKLNSHASSWWFLHTQGNRSNKRGHSRRCFSLLSNADLTSADLDIRRHSRRRSPKEERGQSPRMGKAHDKRPVINDQSPTLYFNSWNNFIKLLVRNKYVLMLLHAFHQQHLTLFQQKQLKQKFPFIITNNHFTKKVKKLVKQKLNQKDISLSIATRIPTSQFWRGQLRSAERSSFARSTPRLGIMSKVFSRFGSRQRRLLDRGPLDHKKQNWLLSLSRKVDTSVRDKPTGLLARDHVGMPTEVEEYRRPCRRPLYLDEASSWASPTFPGKDSRTSSPRWPRDRARLGLDNKLRQLLQQYFNIIFSKNSYFREHWYKWFENKILKPMSRSWFEDGFAKTNFRRFMYLTTEKNIPYRRYNPEKRKLNRKSDSLRKAYQYANKQVLDYRYFKGWRQRKPLTVLNNTWKQKWKEVRNLFFRRLKFKKYLSRFYGNLRQRSYQNLYRQVKNRQGHRMFRWVSRLELKLCPFVVRMKAISNPAFAFDLIRQGHVYVNGQKQTNPHFKIRKNDNVFVFVSNLSDKFFNRPGEKAYNYRSITYRESTNYIQKLKLVPPLFFRIFLTAKDLYKFHDRYWTWRNFRLDAFSHSWGDKVWLMVRKRLIYPRFWNLYYGFYFDELNAEHLRLGSFNDLHKLNWLRKFRC